MRHVMGFRHVTGRPRRTRLGSQKSKSKSPANVHCITLTFRVLVKLARVRWICSYERSHTTRRARIEMSRSVFRPRSSSKRQIHELEQNLLQILCIPLLLFLHLIFIASSLLLRLVQNFGDDHGELQRPRTKASPKHVALTLLLQIPSLKDKSPGVKNRSWSGSRLWNRVRWEVATSFGTSSVKPSRRDVRKRKVEREAIVESVKRLVKWAGEEGVTELSIWDDIGMCSYKRITRGLDRPSRF